MGGAIATAELRTSRCLQAALLGASIVKLLAALDAEAAGFWQGKVIGPARSVAKAAEFHGVDLENNFAKHAGWGRTATASPLRRKGARSATSSFTSSLHLLAGRLGSWPVHWLNIRTELPFARLIKKRVSFTR